MPGRRQFLILGVSVIAFAGMVALVYVGVNTRRRDRDFRFGLEQLDILIQEGRLPEAVPMIPRLADRADDAREMLSILKRGVIVFDSGGGPHSMDEAARKAVRAFPGHRTIRSIAVYAAVMTGDLVRALDWSRSYLSAEFPEMFAWVLLKSGTAPPTVSDAKEDDAFELLFLAGLDLNGRAKDYEQAWRVTGDWRYAADASILMMQSGAAAGALDLVIGASIPLSAPLLAADVLRDLGDDQGALDALDNAEKSDESRVLIRAADALMSMGSYDRASRIYLELIRRTPGLSDVPFLNLAWLAISPQAAMDYYDAAVMGFPDSWSAVEQRALYLAQTDLESAFATLDDYSGEFGGSLELLLQLKLEPNPTYRGYEGAMWSLVEDPNASDDALRFVAWYLQGRAQYDELLILLERAKDGAAWVDTYMGLLHARHGRWGQAEDSFQAAHGANPSWMTALNLALSEFVLGKRKEGMESLGEAERFVERFGRSAHSAEIYLTLARVTADRAAAHDAVTTALELNPTNSEALLLRGLLESGSAY